MDDSTARLADRLEASRLLADRGWGKPVPSDRFDADAPVVGLEHQIYRPVDPERALALARLMVELAPEDGALNGART
jgi:hypothetical protein